VAAVVLIDAAGPFEPVDDPGLATRAAIEPGTAEYCEDAGVDASIIETRELPPFPPLPLVVLTATDHASPPEFEREWQRIRPQIAAQSPRGHRVIAPGSGHDIQNGRPDLVIEQIRQLLLQLRSRALSSCDRHVDRAPVLGSALPGYERAFHAPARRSRGRNRRTRKQRSGAIPGPPDGTGRSGLLHDATWSTLGAVRFASACLPLLRNGGVR
jgi:hypothetical protein